MMETATLTSPARTLMVQPIQKSLSLPSYAKAGGEGIDHKIIFAALEQREKIRRKSKIFKDKEKCGTTRQNYFCLPLPSNNKCRETSLSSDTSCSSLEFQKPKCRASPAMLKPNESDRTPVQNGFTEIGKNTPSPVQLTNHVASAENLAKEDSKPNHQPPLRIDVSRNTVCSSDSMERTERSSKSSNDSLSRKERLVAIKARVEAEREKRFNKSSSEEDGVKGISRHNSDGVIHRTVREVKTKSSKYEKRYRRKTQDEMAIRRALRRQHTSLYLPHTTDLDIWKPPIQRSGSSFSLQKDLEEFSKEFLSANHKVNGSPPFSTNSVINPNYFSDICNDSLRSRYVKPKVQEIETRQQEYKAAAFAVRKDQNKLKTSNHQENGDSFIDYKQKLKHVFYNTKESHFEKPNYRCHDNDFPWKCPSPIPRAPTPPPRSPKSVEFINKVFLQHQKATNFLQDARSLERKKAFLPADLPISVNTNNNTHSHQQNNLQTTKCESPDIPFSSRRNKDMNSRRKTLCNFPQVDEIIATQRPKTPTNSYRSKYPSQNFPPRSPDLSHKLSDSSRRAKGYASGSDISASKELVQPDIPGKKWERLELDSEKKFNSLENRSKANMSMWLKDRWQPRRRSPCLCLDHNTCLCGKDDSRFKVDKKYIDMFQIGAVENSNVKSSCIKTGENEASQSMPTSKTPPIPVDRLSRSEANLSKRSPPKTPSPKLRLRAITTNLSKGKDEMALLNRHNASESLDTAMEELENVYRSLKMSCENLSSITDEHIENSNNYKMCPPKLPPKQTSLLESKSVERSQKQFHDPFFLRDQINKNANKRDFEIPVANSPIDNNAKSNLREALCIEELFSDLTQQLDFEQKQLQDSKNKKTLNSSNVQLATCNASTQEQSRVTESSKSVEKYSYNIEAEHKILNSHSGIQEDMMEKRKQEAVESLSANLSYLMKTNPILPKTEKEKTSDYPSSLRNFDDSRYQDKLEHTNDMSLKNSALESTLCHRSDDSDEIWQVRVSMNSSNAQIDRPTSKADGSCSSYSRLRSALRSPRAGNSREPSPCPSSPSVRERTVDDSSELEKMLSNLLHEVPQAKTNMRPSQAEIQESEQIKTVTKDDSLHQDLQKYRLVNMDDNISKDIMENGKKNTESFQGIRKNFSEKKMDNDSLQNNNYSSQTQRLSFIPVRSRGNHRGKYALPKYKSCDDNRGVTSQRNSPLVGNSSYPASPFQSPVRRHSLGVDDLSNDLSIHVNSNLGQRFQSLGRHASSPNASNTAAITYNLTTFDRVASNHSTGPDLLRNGKANQNDKYQFLHRNSNNSSQRPFSPTCSESSKVNDKVKDKSFIRKSSLNRIEFASTAHHTIDGTPYAPCYYPPEQHSTSEVNSDNQYNRTPPTETSSVSSVKKKSNSFRLHKKDMPGRQTKQDFPGVNAKKEESNISVPLSPRPNDRSVWWRNKRTQFKKKSYSAGEQDSLTDHSDVWKRESLCFSAQEIDSQDCKFKRAGKNVTMLEPKKTLQSLPRFPGSKSEKMTEYVALVTTFKDQTSTCDTTSHVDPGKVLEETSKTNLDSGQVLDVSNEAGVSEDVSCIELENKPDVMDDHRTELNVCGTTAPFEEESLDGDLFVYPQSPTCKMSPHPFPTDDIELKSSTVSADIENNEDNKATSDCSIDNQEDIAKVSSEISSLEISTDSLEASATAKDADMTKQRNSILRRKSDDRKGIHGILKNAGDDKLSWQPPSILKHRDGSEEKDNWSQSDLHSILKKSASEDESCNGSGDIRPILKNTSTDEESSSLNSRPKPILKKRTSFSEECSYACFLSGELKPILKKKTINENSEDQPKPILKIRRKSEEATSSILEFPLGTRPRAYSADRGVRMCNEKKSHDDDLT